MSSETSTAFRLAPMTTDLRLLTVVCLVLPIGAAALARAIPSSVPGVGATLFGALGFMVVIYAAVWLFWRPSRFVVDDAGLRIEWPLRARRIPRAAIGEAHVVPAAEFRKVHGRGMRLGAGGLWGGFGLLVTNAETFSMWISRTDRFVVVRLAGARPLLLTPEDPERFVASLAAVRPALS